MSDRSDSVTQFFCAIFSGEREKTAEMLAHERGLVRAYWTENFNASAMVAAAMSGSTEMVDLLLEFGASPNDGSDWWAGSFSPLITAINRKDSAMTAHLIAKGATVTAYEAAAMGDAVLLKAILDENPNSVNMRAGDGQTPLHLAATPEIAQLLLDRGADLDSKDVDHESTPLQYALQRPNVAKFLLEKGAKGDPFIFAALDDSRWLREAISRDASIVHARIGKTTFPTSDGIDIIYTFTVGNGCTPIHVAAMTGQASNIELLVRAGAIVDARGGYDDSTPMHMAAWHDQPDAIFALARLGADLNLKSGAIHNTAPLVWAIVGGSLRAVEALIDAGAAVAPNQKVEAQMAASGAFDGVRRVPPEDRQRILELVS